MGERAVFYADLIVSLGIAARGGYEPAEPNAEIGRRLMGALNEMTIVIASELAADLRNDGSARSDADLCETLSHWATVGKCGPALDWALRQARSNRE